MLRGEVCPLFIERIYGGDKCFKILLILIKDFRDDLYFGGGGRGRGGEGESTKKKNENEGDLI